MPSEFSIAERSTHSGIARAGRELDSADVLTPDVAVLEEYRPDLLRALREVVCDTAQEGEE